MKHRLLIIAGVVAAMNVAVAWALLAWSHHICAMFAVYSRQWDFIPGFGLLFRPTWTAFTVNTLLFLTCGVFALRRLIRASRRLCPKCAYPVGGSGVCTECGGILPERATA